REGPDADLRRGAPVASVELVALECVGQNGSAVLRDDQLAFHGVLMKGGWPDRPSRGLAFLLRLEGPVLLTRFLNLVRRRSEPDLPTFIHGHHSVREGQNLLVV